MVMGAVGAIVIGELTSISLAASAMKSTLEEIQVSMQEISNNIDNLASRYAPEDDLV